MKLWVLIANSSFAEIYAVEKNGLSITKVQEIDFPDGRKKDSELLSERPGRGFEGPKPGGGKNYGRHAYSTAIDAHTHEQQVFAHRLAEILYKGKNDRSYEQLAIIAPPEFLGELRQTLAENVKKSIYKEVNKDIPASQKQQDRIDSICRLLDLKHPVTSER